MGFINDQHRPLGVFDFLQLFEVSTEVHRALQVL